MSKVTHHKVRPTWRRMFLGPLEWQVMDSIWHLRTCSVHDVVRTIPERRAYTTVMTTVDRLFQKGILNRKKVDRKFLYSARMDPQQLDICFARQLLAQLRLLPMTTRRTVIVSLVEGLSKSGARSSSMLDERQTVSKRNCNRPSTTSFGISGLA